MKAIESLTFIATMAICAKLGMVYVILGCMLTYVIALAIESRRNRRK